MTCGGGGRREGEESVGRRTGGRRKEKREDRRKGRREGRGRREETQESVKGEDGRWWVSVGKRRRESQVLERGC